MEGNWGIGLSAARAERRLGGLCVGQVPAHASSQLCSVPPAAQGKPPALSHGSSPSLQRALAHVHPCLRRHGLAATLVLAYCSPPACSLSQDLHSTVHRSATVPLCIGVPTNIVLSTGWGCALTRFLRSWMQWSCSGPCACSWWSGVAGEGACGGCAALLAASADATAWLVDRCLGRKGPFSSCSPLTGGLPAPAGCSWRPLSVESLVPLLSSGDAPTRWTL